jgi:hypothetical protein
MATRLSVLESFWPGNDIIVLLTERENGVQELILLNMEADLKLLLEAFSDIEVVWAPNGSRALLSYRGAEGDTSLSLLELPSGDITPLEIQVRASKCAWHSGSSDITCGIPAQTTSASRDTVTSVNLATGERRVRYRAPEDVWIGLQDPIILPRGNAIVFINIFDKRAYLISW